MKKIEPKPKPIEKVDEPTPVKPVKEKPDYTWVWALIGLLSIIGVMYFMNINKEEKWKY